MIAPQQIRLAKDASTIVSEGRDVVYLVCRDEVDLCASHTERVVASAGA
jgi:hypothetical protein